VTVADADGHQASDERWVRVDSSGAASVPVQVTDSVTRQPLSGLSIHASTILYDWRDRFGTAVSGEDGKAQLHLESLSQAAASYSVSIPPQVLNGILYASPPVQMKLDPGATSHSLITLSASAQEGQMAGSLVSDDSSASLDGLKVWAIQLPAGPVYQTSLTRQATFSFDPIPVSQYVVTPDLTSLAVHGLSASARNVDLMDSPVAKISFALGKSRPLVGKVLDGEGNSVAFAWIKFNGKAGAHTTDPTSGQFLITDLPSDVSFVTISAPGYYSQSRHVSSDQKSLDFQLVPKPETRRVVWGDGQVVIPPEASTTINGLDISLNNGWLWGKSGASQPLAIHLSGVDVNISNGKFALENVAGQTGWLYLYQGKAKVTFIGGQTPVEVGGGQMIALVESAKPLQMDQTVALSLHPALTESPVPEVVQPSLRARVENWLEKVGIGAAQTITFITYILSLVALFTIPLFVLFWINKRRKTSDSQEHR
jgi:hypothetical protein